MRTQSPTSASEPSQDLLLAIDRRGRIIEANGAWPQMLGYAPEHMAGKRINRFLHRQDWAAFERERVSLLAGRPTWSFQARCRKRLGGYLPMLWSAVWSDADACFYCVGRDLTEREQLQRQLMQSQRLEVIGQLTGGVSHDFNNLLTVIIGAAETLLDQHRDDPSVCELAEMIHIASERGSQLVAQLLAFARQQPLEPTSISLNDLLTGLAPLLSRTLGEDRDLLIVETAEDVAAVADPAQLEAAILNLTVNARDAMSAGGTLTIEASRVTLDETYVRDNPDALAGDYIRIDVTDTGAGISPEVLEHAFEPFFTTKAEGEGSGLGLSMVYGFVRQSQGHVRIHSNLGLGTRVALYLPAAGPDPSEIVRKVAEDAPPGSEHVLLVEDDDLVRYYAQDLLESLGYRVSIAPDAAVALRLFDAADDIRLLFTDVVLPGAMDGRQLAQQVVARRPGVRVLYTSGHTVGVGVLPDGGHLVSKPYRRTELALKLRELLDAEV